MTKPKPKSARAGKGRKPKAKPVTESRKRKILVEAALMAQTAAEIQAVDCAAYSLVMFSPESIEGEWQQRTREALMRFAQFGWAAFHALGGLNTDWNEYSEKILKRLADALPQKKKTEPTPTTETTP